MPLLRVITLVSLIFSATAAANSAVPDYRHLSIRGEAQLKTTPDQAKITLQVKVIKTTALEAKQEADKRVNKLLAGLKSFDITDDDVSASNLLTEPHVNFDENDVEIIAGYVATRTVKVTLSDLNKINEFINFALSLEINEIEDIYSTARILALGDLLGKAGFFQSTTLRFFLLRQQAVGGQGVLPLDTCGPVGDQLID